MSVSKAVLSGKITRTPEKRFTSNNLAITSFAINISSSDEEEIIRVVAMGKLAEKAATANQGNDIIVEGRLQTNVVKNANGEERKIIELSAQALDIISSGSAPGPTSEEALFGEEEIADDLIGEDEIPF